MVDRFAAVAVDDFEWRDNFRPQAFEQKLDAQNMPLWRRNAASNTASSSHNARNTRSHQRSNSEPVERTSGSAFQLPHVPAVSSDWGEVITPMLVENHTVVGQGTSRFSMPIIPEWTYHPDAPPRYEHVENRNDEALDPQALVPVDDEGNPFPDQNPPAYTEMQARSVRPSTPFRPRNGELAAADFPSLSDVRPLPAASGSVQPREPVVEIVELRGGVNVPRQRRE